MADPISSLSLTDSISGLLENTGGLTRELNHAPEDIAASLLRSMQSFLEILDPDELPDNTWATADSGYEGSNDYGSNLHRAVQDCSKTAAELREILQDCRSSSSAKKQDKWRLNQERITTLLTQLERGKVAIQLVLESEQAVRLQAITVQSHNIKVFTLISIFFLPLTFITSIFGMNDMRPQHNFVFIGIMVLLSCVTTYILIGLLTDGSRFGRWMESFMQNFWKERFASLSSVFDYKPKSGPKANFTPAFSSFAIMNARDQLSSLWLGILNWKGDFSNSLHAWKHGRRIDMTYFRWTCQCGRTFHETVRELVPGAAEKWVRSITSGQSERDQTSLSPSSSLNRTPQAIAGAGTVAASYTEASRTEGGLQCPRNDTRSETEIKTTEADPALAEYIILCIKQKQRRVRLFPDDIKDKWTDKETFISIKEIYESERACWRRLNTLSHIEFKKFQLYHRDYVDVSRNEKEEVPECAQKCESGCGNGCVEYWYSPPRVEQAPPIPRNAMVHFLESPSCLGTQRANRAALPKRREILELGDDHAKEGWGLMFKEKVWSLPIVAVQILGIIFAIVVTVIWCIYDETKVGSFLPGVLVICTGQSIAALLQRWAESNLDEQAKAY